MPFTSQNNQDCNLYGFVQFYLQIITLDPCHKKRKGSLETRTELAALRSYVENQAILEPILL